MTGIKGLLCRCSFRAVDVFEEHDDRHEVVSDEAAFFARQDAVSADVAKLRSMQGDYFF
jgi:hypothetical protein